MSLEFETISLEPLDADAPSLPGILRALHEAGVHYSLALGDKPDPFAVRRRIKAGRAWAFDVLDAGDRVGSFLVVDDGMAYFGIVGGKRMHELAGDATTVLAEHFFATTRFDRMYVFVDLRDQALMNALFEAGFERVVDLTTKVPRALIGVILREVFEMPDDDLESEF